VLLTNCLNNFCNEVRYQFDMEIDFRVLHSFRLTQD